MFYTKRVVPHLPYSFQLNQHYDSENKHHIARLVDYFIFRRHLCLVFELLSVNLYELIKQNHFRGLSTNLIRVFMIQLLDALMVLSQANIIHCDMKPENVLLQMYAIFCVVFGGLVISG